MKNKHTIWELRQMQSLPLQAKIQMTRQRIRNWIDEFGEDGVYVSFSGGKDSTVLLDIVRKDYPNIEAVFVNTGLEYPSVRQFALSKENVTELRPTMNFRDVIIKYGYPIISKKIAGYVYSAKRDKNCMRAKYLKGEIKDTIFGGGGRYWFLVDSPFKISDYCCNAMKESPNKKYQSKEHKRPILGTMAEESKNREVDWLHRGCNTFGFKDEISRPMSFWTENDILQYIHENNLDIASAYGKVVRDWDKDGLDDDKIEVFEKYSDIIPNYELPNQTYKITGCKRTGCIFCGFGIAQDKKRFVRLAEQEPKLCDYVMRGGEFWYRVFDKNDLEINLKKCSHEQIEKWCIDNSDNKNFRIESMWQPSKDGLGYWFVLEWLNVHGNLDIVIPNREDYIGRLNGYR